jgi:DNA-binding NtrC family response regulator
MKILVVDDNEFLASTIQAILEREGAEVMSAKDGIDGYSAYLDFKPDVVITDIQMPRKNGLEMMEHIRVHDPMIKTIYMSGDIHSFLPSLKEEKKRYPVSFFEKPFRLESLMTAVSAPAVMELSAASA